MIISDEITQTSKWFSSDREFNLLYPPAIQKLSRKHWTPLEIALKAADYLSANQNDRILDIGSGAGKFCIAAAYYKPNSFFYGVEQRKNLVAYADSAQQKLGLKNISFIHGNFTQLDFKNFDHFYFYNAFYENLVCTDKIDDSIEYSYELFNYYNHYLFKLLEQKPRGTRIVTYHSLEEEIPKDFLLAGSACNDLLKFWIKM